MKYVRILCAVALVFALCSAFTMKDKEKAVYAFGVAASQQKNNIILILYTICIVYLRYANAFAE